MPRIPHAKFALWVSCSLVLSKQETKGSYGKLLI